MYPKPDPKPKNSRKIPKMTPKREAIEREMKKAYKQVDSDRPDWCEDCGSNTWEHSHLFPKDYNGYRYCAEPDNIRKQCRDCHTKWERGHVHLLKNGETYMNYLRIHDDQYFYTKLFQMQDRAKEAGAELSGWALKFLKDEKI